MEEVKFRAWIKKHELMFDIVTICFELKEVVVEHNVNGIGYWTYSFDEVIVMQYTTKKDKNGQEICGGDIINVYEPAKSMSTNAGMLKNENCVVEFNDAAFTYRVSAQVSKGYACMFLAMVKSENIEIRGNIYLHL